MGHGNRVHPIDPAIPCKLSDVNDAHALHSSAFCLFMLLMDLAYHSATKSHGSSERRSVIWVWECGMEGSNGRVEEKAGR